jgi:D-cysteine desulfhydrase
MVSLSYPDNCSQFETANVMHGSRTGPTPVFHARELSSPAAELWIKDDGLTSALYGGNKARKLDLILADAQARAARRIVTVGAAGSHHALATAVFARARGMAAAAVLCPQPATEHAAQTLSDAVAMGLQVHATRTLAAVPIKLVTILRRGDYFVPPGGSNALGTQGYVHAVRELGQQIARGELPEPDLIVVAVGSGGTAAGLVGGAVLEGLNAQVVGVRVGGYSPLTRSLVLSLAVRALRALGQTPKIRDLSGRLELEHGYEGRGYGWPSPEAEMALGIGAGLGFQLDLTYTAKAFAKALELVGFPGLPRRPQPRGAGLRLRQGVTGRPLRVLYWHTLAAARPAALTSPLGGSIDLCPALRELFIPTELPPSARPIDAASK